MTTLLEGLTDDAQQQDVARRVAMLFMRMGGFGLRSARGRLPEMLTFPVFAAFRRPTSHASTRTCFSKLTRQLWVSSVLPSPDVSKEARSTSHVDGQLESGATANRQRQLPNVLHLRISFVDTLTLIGRKGSQRRRSSNTQNEEDSILNFRFKGKQAKRNHDMVQRRLMLPPMNLGKIAEHQFAGLVGAHLFARLANQERRKQFPPTVRAHT